MFRAQILSEKQANIKHNTEKQDQRCSNNQVGDNPGYVLEHGMQVLETICLMRTQVMKLPHE